MLELDADVMAIVGASWRGGEGAATVVDIRADGTPKVHANDCKPARSCRLSLL